MFEDKDQSRTPLSQLGEFGLIDHLTQHFTIAQKSTVKGIGDDADGNDEDVLEEEQK